MSVTPIEKKQTPASLRARKGGTPIVSLTAYTASQARLLDPHCDLLLVGDFLGMVVYGLDSTLPVTLDMMIAHGAAVVRGAGTRLRRSSTCLSAPIRNGPRKPSATRPRIMAETGCAGGEARRRRGHGARPSASSPGAAFRCWRISG